MPPFILASKSPARRRLLEGAGVPFLAVASDVSEQALKQNAGDSQIAADELGLQLARAKAEDVSRRYPNSYVLGADQILVCQGQRFDKPQNLDQARMHLMYLRGRRHQLINGLVIVKDGEPLWQHTARVNLTIRNFSDGFLDAYMKRVGDDVLSSVGGYQLEDFGSQLFAEIDGDYFSILGLPLLPLLAYLRHIQILQD